MERELNEINVIPLVDVMLVLLVIVLTTATFITLGQIPVNLAKATEAENPQEASIVLTLTAEGQLYVNDEPVTGKELTLALNGYGRSSPVVVRADRVTVLERFVSVVDDVRSMGFQQVSLEVIRS